MHYARWLRTFDFACGICEKSYIRFRQRLLWIDDRAWVAGVMRSDYLHLVQWGQYFPTFKSH